MGGDAILHAPLGVPIGMRSTPGALLPIRAAGYMGLTAMSSSDVGTRGTETMHVSEFGAAWDKGPRATAQCAAGEGAPGDRRPISRAPCAPLRIGCHLCAGCAMCAQKRLCIPRIARPLKIIALPHPSQ